MPGGRVLTLTMTPEAERMLMASMYQAKSGRTLEKDPQLGKTADGRPLIQAQFAMSILQNLARHNTSEGEVPVRLTGRDEPLMVTVRVTNPKGQMVNPTNIAAVRDEMQTDIGKQEDKRSYGYQAKRVEKS